MKYVGAHVSAAGGVGKAPLNAAEIGARAFALFTRNQRQWAAKPLAKEEIAAFRTNCREKGYTPAQILAHDGYLINLGHPEKEGLAKSRAAFLAEMRRCEALGITLLNFHPGSHLRIFVGGGLPRPDRRIDRHRPRRDRRGDRRHRKHGGPGEQPRFPLRADRPDHRAAQATRAGWASASTPPTPSPPAMTSGRRRPLPPPWRNSTGSWVSLSPGGPPERLQGGAGKPRGPPCAHRQGEDRDGDLPPDHERRPVRRDPAHPGDPGERPVGGGDRPSVWACEEESPQTMTPAEPTAGTHPRRCAPGSLSLSACRRECRKPPAAHPEPRGFPGRSASPRARRDE